MASVVILGLDLSLTASAAVAVPVDWDGNWSCVRSLVVGEKLTKEASDTDRVMRTDMIASRICSFARTMGVMACFIEGYAFGARAGRERLGELGGVVRLALVRGGFEIHTVPTLSARKLLLGNVPRSKQKEAVQEALKAAGAPASWSPDEFDAFTVANWGLSEGGGYCFAQVEAA